jgi:cysteine synthase A
MTSSFLEHGFELVPRPVRLRTNLFAIAFFLMKLVPAAFMLRRAKEEGLIDSQTVIIETSSGNFGMGLALECHRLGMRFVLVTDPAVAPVWRRRLTDLGTTVSMVETTAGDGNVQNARLARLEQEMRRHPNHYVPGQYNNLANRLAYSSVAERIADDIGHVDVLVAATGSGASGCGTAGFLRVLNPDLRFIAVDTHNSVLFGQPNGPRSLRGLGNSKHPANLDHTAVDDVHWVQGPVAFQAMRRLYREHRLYQGPTSGASFLVADDYARKHPDQIVVFLCPDHGERYPDLYDQEWLRRNGLHVPVTPADPHEVDSPLAASGDWDCFQWCRRPYGEVTGEPLIRPEVKA